MGIECTSLRMCDQQSGPNKADIPICVSCCFVRGDTSELTIGVCVCDDHRSAFHCFSLCRNLELDCDCRRNVLRVYTFLAGLSESVSHDVSCGETIRLVRNSPLVCLCVWRSSFCFALLLLVSKSGGQSRLTNECIARVHIAHRIAFLAGLSESVSHNVSCGENTSFGTALTIGVSACDDHRSVLHCIPLLRTCCLCVSVCGSICANFW